MDIGRERSGGGSYRSCSGSLGSLVVPGCVTAAGGSGAVPVPLELFLGTVVHVLDRPGNKTYTALRGSVVSPKMRKLLNLAPAAHQVFVPAGARTDRAWEGAGAILFLGDRLGVWVWSLLPSRKHPSPPDTETVLGEPEH